MGLINKFFLISLMGFLSFSCIDNAVYHEFKQISAAQWSKHDTLMFSPDSLQVSPNERYDIYLEVLHNKGFGYQNLWLFVTPDANDSLSVQDTLQVQIADRFGKWHGVGAGGLVQVDTLLLKGVTFAPQRKYVLQIVQGMRDEPLSGIEKVGVKVVKASTP